MSRIDEALKRATRGGIIQDATPSDSPADATGAELSSYPPEPGGFEIPPGAAHPGSNHGAAIVPRLSRERVVSDSPEFAGKLVVSTHVPATALEQYRRLAGTIHELQVERGLRTLMITSAVPHEGKTLTVANLALTLTESYGRRVLLIDADFRRPMVHALFGVPNDRGLGDALRWPSEEVPFRVISDKLTVLTAGQVDQPMESLTSDGMRELIERCTQTFDWVLLDAPPVAMMPDARLLANVTRAVLFVIAARSTPHAIVARALEEFEPESVVGTVLNRVSEEDIPATDYYKDYYYRPSRPVG